MKTGTSIFLWLALTILFGCSKPNPSENNPPQVVTQYCGSCHLVPDPSLLDKNTWRKLVLPAMAKQLGLEVWQGHNYFQGNTATITIEDWNKILAYYEDLAPIQLGEIDSNVQPSIDTTLFEISYPLLSSKGIATTTLVKIDTLNHQVWVGNAENNHLVVHDQSLHAVAEYHLPSPAVGMINNSDETVVTCIGELKAIDVKAGELMQISQSSKMVLPLTKNQKFNRPIHTSITDINKDGLTDYVVSSFGHNQGGLYLLKQNADHTFESITLREIAGATESTIIDFNHDGWPDIVALFAHGDEGIWLFTNNKKGGFVSQPLLRFPPVYGSSGFQLVDFDNDGKLDILYTAGDNSDYSRILKPYHGIYIYKNMGNQQFQQAYFYPINGATKAFASDFDQDGDLDLVTIAFFADLKNRPFEKFTYLKNEHTSQSQDWVFKPLSLGIIPKGRWICMDVGDIDGDGDQDIVLGNYSKGFLNQENFSPTWDVKSPFLLLKNKTY